MSANDESRRVAAEAVTVDVERDAADVERVLDVVAERLVRRGYDFKYEVSGRTRKRVTLHLPASPGGHSGAPLLPPSWHDGNERRIDLLRKRQAGRLSATEQGELRALDRLLGAALDSVAPLPPLPRKGAGAPPEAGR